MIKISAQIFSYIIIFAFEYSFWSIFIELCGGRVKKCLIPNLKFLSSTRDFILTMRRNVVNFLLIAKFYSCLLFLTHPPISTAWRFKSIAKYCSSFSNIDGLKTRGARGIKNWVRDLNESYFEIDLPLQYFYKILIEPIF